MLAAIRQWVIKTMMKGQTGVVRTLPKQDIIEMNTQITAERIMRNGINPNDLKTVGQVENVVEQIDAPKVVSADSAEGKGITEQLLGKKKAPVFDMEGNKIPEGAKIMSGKEVESDAAIKARLVADNEKGIAGIKISLVDDSIAKIKSLEPMDAMKEANLVAGKKGRYANLDDNQVKKIMDDTNDHIFQDADPIEDFETGGRVGLKGGAFLNFLKKFKIKQSGDDVKEFLSKRQFMKDIVGNTEKSKKARELRKIKQNVDNYMKQYKGYQFPSDEQIKIDLEKKIQPILNKERKLNADGGRIGYAGGSDMGTVSGATRSANTGLKGGYQNTGTGPVERTGGGDGGNNKPPRVVTRTVTKPSVKNKIRRTGNTIGDISYFKNLINFNPVGLAKNIGGKILMDKILGDQSNLETEEEYDFSGIEGQTAGLNQEQVNFLDKIGTTNQKVGNTDFYTYNTPTEIKDKIESLNSKSDSGIFSKEFNPDKIVEGDKNTYATDQDVENYMKNTYQLGTAKNTLGLADGGRIGLKAGSVDKMRRLILKTIGAGTAGIAGAKSGIFSFGKGATKQVAKEVAQQTTSGMPPPYFFKLAEKIKKMGDDVTAKSATKDREVVTKFKEYELTEDVATGEMTIQRMKVLDDDSGSYYGKNLTEETYMNYKPGLADETTKGKIPPGEYEEGTALLRNDKEFAGDVVDESFKISDDVLEEVGEAKSIKYASGGLAYMLGE